MTQPPVSPVPGLSGLTVIAHGGYSTVYRARQDSIGREVALKIDTRTLEEERDRRRFLREAEAAGRLSGHPHIVHVYDAGVTNESHPYLVMELYSGGSYSAKLRKEGPRPPSEVRDLGIKIADALQAAHSAGVLHRDVKPANILINRFGVPGLTDFGLAAVVEANRDISVTVEALTPAYAPPEVFRLDKPTAAGDIYSLCATLYSLLAGKPPRWPDTGSPPSPFAMVTLHNEPIPNIPGVPQGLLDVLRTGMASNPTQRYSSATALRDALAELNVDGSRKLDPAWLLASPPIISPAPLPPSQAPVFHPPKESVPKGNGRLVAILAMLLVLLAGAVGLASFLALKDNPAPKPRSPQAVQGPCPFSTEEVSCPFTPECFNEAGDNLSTVLCSRPHTWEAFVRAELPETITEISSAASKDPFIATLCSKRGLETALKGSADAFRVRTLLPTQQEFTSGERQFQCLAAIKGQKSDKSLFTRMD